MTKLAEIKAPKAAAKAAAKSEVLDVVVLDKVVTGFPAKAKINMMPPFPQPLTAGNHQILLDGTSRTSSFTYNDIKYNIVIVYGEVDGLKGQSVVIPDVDLLDFCRKGATADFECDEPTRSKTGAIYTKVKKDSWKFI